MRLGQIARKLDIQPKVIIKELNKQFNLQLEQDPNQKISEEYILWLEKELVKPNSETTTNVASTTEEKNTEEIQTSTTILSESGADSVPDSISTPSKSKTTKKAKVVKPIKEEKEVTAEKTEKLTAKKDTPVKVIHVRSGEKISTSADADSEYYELDENVEVIRAPKINLEGIKVLGKIELPEPKKKEVVLVEPEPMINTGENTTENGETDQLEQSTTEVSPPAPPDLATLRKLEYEERKRKREERAEKKRIREEREKKRKEQEALKAEQRKKQQQIDAEKERRRLAYLEKLKEDKSTAKKAGNKKSKKNQSGEYASIRDQRPAPKTLLGKFWRWLNT